MKLGNKFRINIFSLVYVLLALFCDRLFYLSIYYIIGLIHELFHVLMAKFLKVNVDEIVFYPFGFIAKMKTLIYEKEWKQYLILLFGPISFFFSLLFINVFYYFDMISIYAYNYAINANVSVLIVNLLPIYPLDGEKILENIISHFIDELKVRYFRIIISIITLFISIYFMFSLGNFISFCFLLVTIITSIFSLKEEYIYYLISRLFLTLNTKKKIVRKNAIFRFYDNYKFTNNGFENEEEIIKNIIEEEKVIEKLKKREKSIEKT